jgi:CRISPR system Cascade subunit CasD
MRFFTMHLSGSVASFAGVQYDAAPSVLPVPTRSMITGMLGGAMGWSYRDHALLQELQDELDLGFVVHEPGTVIWDFQTTDMTKPHMVGAIWTLDTNASLGVFKRGGGGKERDTASRPLTCGIDITAIVGVERDPEPLLAALRRPVFPVTLGRRGMFPTDPIAGEALNVGSVANGVEHVASRRPGSRWTPVSVAGPGIHRTVPGGRDWRTRRHGGSDTYAVA